MARREVDGQLERADDHGDVRQVLAARLVGEVADTLERLDPLFLRRGLERGLRGGGGLHLVDAHGQARGAGRPEATDLRRGPGLWLCGPRGDDGRDLCLRAPRARTLRALV